MKNLKKVLALVVVFAMMMSTLAFAAGFPDVAADADYANAINVLSDLGFFTGDDKGNFNPDATITRAEYAVVVCRILGLNAAGVSEFADVAADHWATGYVNAASQAGIIKGYGNGNFGPSDPVKYEEAVTMLVRALGYEPLAISKGNWPQGHINVASSYGLLTAVDGSVGEGAKRSAVAAMTYNALDIPVVEQTGFGTDVQYTIMKQTDDQDKVTLLTKLDVFKADGVVKANAKVAYGVYAEEQEKGYIQVSVTDDYDNPDKALRFEDNKNGKLDPEEDALITLRDEADLAADYIASNVTVYFEKYATGKYDLVAIEAAAGAEVLALDLADVNGATTVLDPEEDQKAVIKYYKDGASKTTNANLEITSEGEPNFSIVLNDELLTSTDLATIKGKIKDGSLVGNVELIDWDNDNKYDIIDITSYIHVVVDNVDAKNGIITTYNTGLSRINLDIDNEEALVTVKDVNGADIDFATIKEYDVLALVVSPSPLLNNVNFSTLTAVNKYDSLDIINLGQTKVEGIVKGQGQTSNEEPVYTIAGNKYEYEPSMKLSTDINYLENDIEIGAEGTFFLGINGKIVGFEGSKAADGNYAFIIGAFADRKTNSTITLLTEDGIKTYKYADKVKLTNPYYEESVKLDITKNLNTIGTFDHDDDDETSEISYLANTAWSGYASVADKLYAKLGTDFNEEIEDISDAAAWATNTYNINNRLIQFNVNSDGEISEIIPAYVGTADKQLIEFAKDEDSTTYKASTQRLNSKPLADDVVVFDIDTEDLLSSSVKDLSYFVDESAYGAILYDKNDDNEYQAAVVVDSISKFAVGAPLAIVTNVEHGVNEETDADIATLTVAVNGAEATIVVDAEETNNGGAVIDAIGFGTIMLYNADSAGLVSDYEIVGNADLDYDGKMYMNFEFADGFDTNVDSTDASEDDAYYFGYLVNNKKNLELKVVAAIAADDDAAIAADSTPFAGLANANQYLFTSSGKTKQFEIGDAVGSLTAHKVAEDPYNFVLVRTVDGAIQEVIGFAYDDDDADFTNNAAE